MELTFTVGGEEIPLRLSLKAIVRFENETRVAVIAPGVEFSESLDKWIAANEPGWVHRVAQFLYMGLLHSKKFKTFDDFMDRLTDEELAAAVVKFTEVGQKQLASAPETEGGGDGAPNPTEPEKNCG